MSRTASTLTELLARGTAIAAPGVHDVLSARVVEMAGFSALYCGGNAMGIASGKGQPFVTLTETTAILRRISEAVDLPLIVDAGAGFGEPQHVFGAVREIEAAGASAMHIDDQPFPKQAGYHRKRGTIVDTPIMIERLKAALAARRNDGTMIFARTDALRVKGSRDEALDRARAYAEAGIDGLLVLDLSPDDAPAFKEAIGSLPLIWIGGVAPPIPTFAELDQAGFALALYPFNGIAAVATALGDLWNGLARDGRIAQEAELLSRAGKQVMEVVDMATYWRIEDGELPNVG